MRDVVRQTLRASRVTDSDQGRVAARGPGLNVPASDRSGHWIRPLADMGVTTREAMSTDKAGQWGGLAEPSDLRLVRRVVTAVFAA